MIVKNPATAEAANSIALESARANPALYLELLHRSPEERVQYLIGLARQMPVICGESEGDTKPDEHLDAHIELLFRAVQEAETTYGARLSRCARIAVSLYQEYTDEKIWPGLVRPKTFDSLLSRIASCIANSVNAGNAAHFLEQLAQSYLSTSDDSRHDAIRRALNKARGACTSRRLAECIVTLSNITTWSYGDKDTIFTTSAIGLVTKQIEANPAAITRSAKLELIIGDSFSEFAERSLLDYALSLKQVDESTQSLLQHFLSHKLGSFDGTLINVAKMQATAVVRVLASAKDVFVTNKIEDMVACGKTWRNPHHGMTTIKLEIRNQVEVLCYGVVEGIPTENSAAA